MKEQSEEYQWVNKRPHCHQKEPGDFPHRRGMRGDALSHVRSCRLLLSFHGSVQHGRVFNEVVDQVLQGCTPGREVGGEGITIINKTQKQFILYICTYIYACTESCTYIYVHCMYMYVCKRPLPPSLLPHPPDSLGIF